MAFCHSLQFETNGPLSYLASPVQLGSAHQKRRAYFDDLHAMNVESIRARCGASAEVAIAASFEPELPDPAKLANIWQMLKSIDGLLYQCSSVHTEAKIATYRALDKLRVDICRVLCNDQPGYKAAGFSDDLL